MKRPVQPPPQPTSVEKGGLPQLSDIVRNVPVIAIDLQSSHQEMPDGTHKITLEVGNLPSLAWAQRVSDWLQVLIRANASQIGQLDRSKQQ